MKNWLDQDENCWIMEDREGRHEASLSLFN